MTKTLGIEVDLKCTICNAFQSKGCGCWTRCSCGWSFRTGEQCRNPVHNSGEVGKIEITHFKGDLNDN